MPEAAAARVAAILRSDALRWRLLAVARDHGPPGGWIAAGFVRDAVWDREHGRPPRTPDGDADVVWFDPVLADRERDRSFEAALDRAEPGIAWSVKNQARMHRRNGDPPYRSLAAAMRCWPETATAVAARRTRSDDCAVLAPCGLGDLLALRLRPGPAMTGTRAAVFAERVREKQWLARWPRLRMVANGPDPG